jgi:hypothetical protein
MPGGELATQIEGVEFRTRPVAREKIVDRVKEAQGPIIASGSASFLSGSSGACTRLDQLGALTYDGGRADTLVQMRLQLSTAALLASLVGTGGPVRALSAQSLADVARQEEERRKNVKDPAKVITNKDLGSVPASPVQPSSSADGSESSSAKASEGKDGQKDGEKGKSGEKDKSKEPPKDQAYWAGRLKELQTQLDRDQAFSAALQSQINGLTAEFTSRDDPAQRAVIEQNRQKALGEMNRLKDAIVKDKKAIDDFNDEARRAGVPPGWLR